MYPKVDRHIGPGSAPRGTTQNEPLQTEGTLPQVPKFMQLSEAVRFALIQLPFLLKLPPDQLALPVQRMGS